jgi:hypothetical protein
VSYIRSIAGTRRKEIEKKEGKVINGRGVLRDKRKGEGRGVGCVLEKKKEEKRMKKERKKEKRVDPRRK